MADRLVVFEDSTCRRFAPLSHTRPVFELLCGLMSLRERCERAFRSRAALVCRPHVAPLVAETTGRVVNTLGRSGSILLVNGRLLDPYAVAALIARDPEPASWWNGDELIAARVPSADVAGLAENLAGNGFLVDPHMVAHLPRHLSAAALADSLWGLVLANGAQIERDAGTLAAPAASSGFPSGVQVIGERPLVIAAGAAVEPGAVLDLRGGAIVIGAAARVRGLTHLEGPAGIGARTQVLGGRIRAGTTIGPGCRVAGEIEASIFLGNANKYHDGFIGHAYIGEWVNLGAMTTNSDLKNTYGTVKVWRDGRLIDTGEQKVGVMIGDHAKTGIGSLIDTGTVIGVSANIYGGSAVLATKWVPSFSWGMPPELTLYDPMRALATMEEVMRRRGVTLTAAYQQMVDGVFELTRPEREFAGIADI